MLFFASTASLKSENCGKEIDYAKLKGVDIVPVLLEGVTDDLRLGDGISVSDPDHLDRLVDRLS